MPDHDYTDAELIDIEEDTRPVLLEVNMHMGLAAFIPRNMERTHTHIAGRESFPVVLAIARGTGAVMVDNLRDSGVLAHVTYHTGSTVFSAYQCNAPSPVCELAAHALTIDRCVRIFRESMAEWCIEMEQSANA